MFILFSVFMLSIESIDSNLELPLRILTNKVLAMDRIFAVNVYKMRTSNSSHYRRIFSCDGTEEDSAT